MKAYESVILGIASYTEEAKQACRTAFHDQPAKHVAPSTSPRSPHLQWQSNPFVLRARKERKGERVEKEEGGFYSVEYQDVRNGYRSTYDVTCSPRSG